MMDLGLTDWFRQPPNPKKIRNVDGWADFVARRYQPPPPDLLSEAQYGALSRRDRGLYDLGRRNCAANLPKHDFPMAQEVRRQIENTLSVNTLNTDPGGRPGIFVSAESGLGKSTLLRETAAASEESVRDMHALVDSHPSHDLDRWIPVVWINVPSKVTIRGLCRRIIKFYNEPPRKADTETQLTERAHDLIDDCGTRLIVLDDITRLKMHREADQDASDWIRDLQETSATVIGIGVNVERSGLLYEGTVSTDEKHLMTQTRRRFTVYQLRRFTYDTDADTAAWVAHLKAVEADLPLMHKEDGMLSDDLAEFLFRRTKGVIGSLSRYIAEATTSVIGRPIRDGGEHLTEPDFLAIRLDHAAEEDDNTADVDPDDPPPPQRGSRAKRRANSVYNGARRKATA